MTDHVHVTSERWCAYLAGTLAAEELIDVEQAIASCPTCASALEREVQAEGLYREAVREVRRPRGALSRRAVVGIGLALAAGVLLWSRGQLLPAPPPPYRVSWRVDDGSRAGGEPAEAWVVDATDLSTTTGSEIGLLLEPQQPEPHLGGLSVRAWARRGSGWAELALTDLEIEAGVARASHLLGGGSPLASPGKYPVLVGIGSSDAPPDSATLEEAWRSAKTFSLGDWRYYVFSLDVKSPPQPSSDPPR